MAEPISVTIEVAPGAFEKMQRRVAELGFADVDTYLLYLIAVDIADDKVHAANLMKLVYQAEASGDGREVNDALRRELVERTNRIIQDAAAKSKQAVG